MEILKQTQGNEITISKQTNDLSMALSRWAIPDKKTITGILYTEQAIVDRLSSPDDYTDNRVFEGNSSSSRRVRTDFISAAQRLYDGPVYLQGMDPTCAAWAITHATYAVGAEPSVKVTKELLNQALLSRGKEEDGLNVFQEAGIVNGDESSTVSLELISDSRLTGFFGTKPDLRNVSTLVRQTIEDDSALVVSIKQNDFHWSGKQKHHAICIAGFKIDTNGFMDLQVVDSALGVYPKPLEQLIHDIADVPQSFTKVSGK